MRLRTRIQILLSLLVLQLGLQAASPDKLMRSGWFEWEPYNYAHVLFAWGFIFALFLHWESDHPQTHAVVAGFIATMAGVFITTFAMKLREMRLAVGR